MTTINTVASGLNNAIGQSRAAVDVVAEGQAVKHGAASVPVASPILLASTVVKLGTASSAPLTYESLLTNSVDHLRAGISQFLGHGE
jgi:hypothetical protein